MLVQQASGHQREICCFICAVCVCKILTERGGGGGGAGAGAGGRGVSGPSGIRLVDGGRGSES